MKNVHLRQAYFKISCFAPKYVKRRRKKIKILITVFITQKARLPLIFFIVYTCYHIGRVTLREMDYKFIGIQIIYTTKLLICFYFTYFNEINRDHL